MTSGDDNDSGGAPPPSECALCGAVESRKWVELATAGGAAQRVAVCSSCFVDCEDTQATTILSAAA